MKKKMPRVLTITKVNLFHMATTFLICEMLGKMPSTAGLTPAMSQAEIVKRGVYNQDVETGP